jgi:hypothetical protein
VVTISLPPNPTGCVMRHHLGPAGLDQEVRASAGKPRVRDRIILPGRVLPNWWRQEGHALVLDDLGDVLDDLPERLIVGTGASGQMRPDPETLEALRRRAIDVEVARTGEAVRLFADADPAATGRPSTLTC